MVEDQGVGASLDSEISVPDSELGMLLRTAVCGQARPGHSMTRGKASGSPVSLEKVLRSVHLEIAESVRESYLKF